MFFLPFFSVPVVCSEQSSQARAQKIPSSPTCHLQTSMLEWIFSSFPGTIHILKYNVKTFSIIPFFFSGVIVGPMRPGAEKEQLLNYTSSWERRGRKGH